LVERAFLLGRSLVAQKVPFALPYQPVWRVAWHSSLWSAFDRSLIVNFLLGQWYQAAQRSDCGQIMGINIQKMIREMLPRNAKVMLSAPARRLVIDKQYRYLLSFLTDERRASEEDIGVEMTRIFGEQ
jgi:hypothetical protein